MKSKHYCSILLEVSLKETKGKNELLREHLVQKETKVSHLKSEVDEMRRENSLWELIF